MTRIFLVLLVAAAGGVCQSCSDSQRTDDARSNSYQNSDDRGRSSRGDTRASSRDRQADGSTRAQMDRTSTASQADLLSILLMKDHEETQIGQLAQRKATSEPAKRLANMLVSDHQQHAKSVMDAAQAAGLTLLDDNAAKQALARLQNKAPDREPDPMALLNDLDGGAFDAKFGQLMRQGHSDLIKVVENARPQMSNDQVAALIDKTLPVLRHHEEMAREVEISAQ